MGININKYNSREDYLADGNKPQGKCLVSQIMSDVKYDGKNVMLRKGQMESVEVCLVVKEIATGEIFYIPLSTYDSATFDTTKYAFKDFVRYGSCLGKELLIHKNEHESCNWAIFNRYQIVCDLTQDGGFTATITINGAAKTNTVAWQAGDTLQSVIDQFRVTVSTHLPKPVAGTLYSDEETACINVTTGGYSNSTLTLSNNTGATLHDLSLYCKINGVEQTEAHRTWQALNVSALFPALGFNAANTACYARNGFNKQYRCGVNRAKFKQYFSASGAAEYKTENGNEIMKESVFNALADSEVEAQKALYDKYHGSYDEYIDGQMIQLNDTHKDGHEYQSHGNGAEQTWLISDITTVDFDGTWIAAFTAANRAASITDEDFGRTHLADNYEIALFMSDECLSQINEAFSIIGGTKVNLSNSNYYWGVAEYNAYIARIFYGTDGNLNYGLKYGSSRVRFLASV